MSDLYAILGVNKDATETEIKKAYRTMSLKYHPDRNPNEETTTKFQEISEAYETLGDSNLRKEYDMKGSMPEGMNFSGAEQFQDLNSIFSMMFGGQGMPGMPGMPGMHTMQGMHSMQGMPGMNPRVNIYQNGHPTNVNGQFQIPTRIKTIVKQIDLTMEQCYNGCVYPINIERTIVSNNESKLESETLYVNIPSGINTGENIILHEKGNIVNSQKGPVNIQIHVTKNDIFIRDGINLIYNKTISLKDALCGFTIEINHLNGKKFALNNSSNPSIIKPHFKKIIPNLGMKRENTIGNLIVLFEIEFPDQLSKEQIESLKTIL
jgi:DnaJ-class molecular chaperone